MCVYRRVYVLVDGRHGIKDSDIQMMALLDSARLPYQIVLTKADDASPIELMKALQSVFIELTRKVRGRTVLPIVHVTSARTRYGIDHFSLSIAEILSQKWVVKSPSELVGMQGPVPDSSLTPEGLGNGLGQVENRVENDTNDILSY